MITVTNIAYNKIVKLMSSRNKGVGIRLGVRTTGCSGLAYTLEYVDEYKVEPGTINYAQKDFVILVDQKHDVYLQGLTLDYVRNGLNEGFEFINPNERDRCGCGESFRI
jgi:iron-sulfur cluster assembly protein